MGVATILVLALNCFEKGHLLIKTQTSYLFLCDLSNNLFIPILFLPFPYLICFS